MRSGAEACTKYELAYITTTQNSKGKSSDDWWFGRCYTALTSRNCFAAPMVVTELEAGRTKGGAHEHTNNSVVYTQTHTRTPTRTLSHTRLARCDRKTILTNRIRHVCAHANSERMRATFASSPFGHRRRR